MKKQATLLFTVAILISAVRVSAQSFKKGTMVLDLKGELGLYNTVSTDKNAVTSTGASATVSHNDRAGSKINNLGFEYGVLPWLGVGIKFQHDNYFTSKDSTATSFNSNGTLNYEYYKPAVKGSDFSVVVNAHPVRAKKFDLVTGINIGYSTINLISNNPYHFTATGKGSWLDAHVTTRFYFGNHFGLNLNLAYAGYNYANLFTKDDNNPSKNTASLKGSGVNFGIGLQYKFTKYEKD